MRNEGSGKLVGACMGVAILFGAGQALAGTDLNVGDTVRFYDREGSTGGGEFEVENLTNLTKPNFRTFCVEGKEYIDFNSKGFIVASISDQSVGQDSSLNKPLHEGTAFLYSQFRKGILPGYDFTPNSAAHILAADELQKAIWELQGQVNGAANAYYLYALDAIDTDSDVRAGNIYGDNNAWNNMGIGNVRIANMIFAADRNGMFREGQAGQDQLILVPSPSAATAGLTLIGGLGICAFIRRRETAL